MASFALQSRRAVQPQGAAEIDRSNPIARGLVFLQGAASGLINGASMVGDVTTISTAKGMAWSFAGASGRRLFTGLQPAVTGPCTYVTILIPNGSNLSTYQPFVAQGDRSQLRLFNSSFQFFTYNGSGWNQVNMPGLIAAYLGKPTLVAGRHTGSQNVMDLVDLTNGSRSRGSVAATARSYGTLALTVGSEIENVSRVTSFPILMCAVWNRALGDAEISELANNPWQLFKPLQRIVWSAPSTLPTVDLSAAASGGATAGAQLLKGVTLSGAALGVTSAQASVSQTVPLSASATIQATSTGQMTLGVTLTASALSAALAGATATIQKTLGASGLAQATGVASLQVGGSSSLAANASAIAQSGATLMLAINLNAAALAQATSTAGFSTPKPLAATATAAAEASATLLINIPLQANAIGRAAAGAGLSLSVPLSADALGAASSTAGAQVSYTLQASGSAVATAYASLSAGGSTDLHATRGYFAHACKRHWHARSRGTRSYTALSLGRNWSAKA